MTGVCRNSSEHTDFIKELEFMDQRFGNRVYPKDIIKQAKRGQVKLHFCKNKINSEKEITTEYP